MWAPTRDFCCSCSDVNIEAMTSVRAVQCQKTKHAIIRRPSAKPRISEYTHVTETHQKHRLRTLRYKISRLQKSYIPKTPPEISTTLPFIYLAPSPIKNTTTSATSSGLPTLPRLTALALLATASGPSTTFAFVGVSIYPGATTLHLIPFGPSSSAMLLEKPMTPYLLAQ